MKEKNKYIISLAVAALVVSLAFGITQVSAEEKTGNEAIVKTSEKTDTGIETCGCKSPCSCGCQGYAEKCGCLGR